MEREGGSFHLLRWRRRFVLGTGAKGRAPHRAQQHWREWQGHWGWLRPSGRASVAVGAPGLGGVVSHPVGLGEAGRQARPRSSKRQTAPAANEARWSAD